MSQSCFAFLALDFVPQLPVIQFHLCYDLLDCWLLQVATQSQHLLDTCYWLTFCGLILAVAAPSPLPSGAMNSKQEACCLGCRPHPRQKCASGNCLFAYKLKSRLLTWTAGQRCGGGEPQNSPELIILASPSLSLFRERPIWVELGYFLPVPNCALQLDFP